MNVTFAIHLDPTDRDIVWWAETENLPGLSVAAPTLRELRTLIEQAVSLHIGEAAINLVLVTDDAPSNPETSVKDAPFAVPATELSDGPRVRMTPTTLRSAA